MSTDLLITTADELLEMPPDGFRYELIAGVLKKMSPAGWEHGRIGAFLTAHLMSHVLSRHLGLVFSSDTGFRIEANPDTVLSPDVAFITKARAATIADRKKFVPFAPDLAIEILSPSDRYSETLEKVDEWLTAGSRAVVLVDPRRQDVTVYRSPSERTVLSLDDVLEVPDIVPGWSVSVSEIFVEPQ